MPDPYLVGNGRWCSCCFPSDRPRTRLSGQVKQSRSSCNECAGAGRIVFSAQEILAATVGEARAWKTRASRRGYAQPLAAE